MTPRLSASENLILRGHSCRMVTVTVTESFQAGWDLRDRGGMDKMLMPLVLTGGEVRKLCKAIETSERRHKGKDKAEQRSLTVSHAQTNDGKPVAGNSLSKSHLRIFHFMKQFFILRECKCISYCYCKLRCHNKSFI